MGSTGLVLIAADQAVFSFPNPQVGRLIMALNPVIMPIQAKTIFHPLGEGAESRESRNMQHPQEFRLVNLWIWVIDSKKNYI
jgi:hypothetical protein